MTASARLLTLFRPNFTPGRSPLPALFRGRNASARSHLRTLLPHLVYVKPDTTICLINPQYMVFYHFEPKQVILTAEFNPPQRWPGAKPSLPHAFANRVATSVLPVVLPHGGERKSRNLRFDLAPNGKNRELTHALDCSPAMQAIQRPFSVQLCGWLWIMRKSGAAIARQVARQPRQRS
jgi:hypothetical protein